MKCGMYVTVCSTFFAFAERIWLSISAKMIGIGKPATRLVTLILIVFQSTFSN